MPGQAGGSAPSEPNVTMPGQAGKKKIVFSELSAAEKEHFLDFMVTHNLQWGA